MILQQRNLRIVYYFLSLTSSTCLPADTILWCTKQSCSTLKIIVSFSIKKITPCSFSGPFVSPKYLYTQLIYVGELNENLKFVIKNRNFALLSCKLVSVLQTASRMACRWQHIADAKTQSQYQYKDGCPT